MPYVHTFVCDWEAGLRTAMFSGPCISGALGSIDVSRVWLITNLRAAPIQVLTLSRVCR